MKETAQICYDARNYDILNASVLLLSKKHGQLKAVIQAMVEQVMGWLEEIKEREGTEKWLQLIETLRTVTDGKVGSLLSLFMSFSTSPDFPRNATSPRNPPPSSPP